MIKWIKDRLSHKLEHLKWDNIKNTFREHGTALVVIIIGWEIIEDIIFPLIFAFLGNNVHPGFYAGIPASLIICVHWLMVPLLWGFWIKYSGQKDSNIDISSCDHNCDSDSHK